MKKEITYVSAENQDSVSIERKIAKEYDMYFTALNTLVNSTMHNERQFVQSTAFNAVFYSVSPKIMAFYNAYMYRVKQILRDTKCKEEYTFLIYPSFSPTISVEQISLDDNLPTNRLLTIRISEKYAQSAALDEIRVCLEAYNQEVSKEIGEEEHYAEKESILHIGKLLSEFDFTNGIQFKQSLADRQEQKVNFNTEMEDAAFWPDAVNGLYEYLLEVMKASLEEYIKPEKQEMIREVRNVVNKILTFEDTAEVFNCIEEELSIYKREGCKIQDSVF